MDQHLSIEKTGIQGLYVVNPASYKSDEDLIVETYNSQELLKNSLNMTFVQENQSMSVKGVLRGLHVQKNFPQGKLVRVVRGKIYDVAVDTRTTSSTYGDWYGVELSADNKKQFYIQFIQVLLEANGLAAGKDHQFKGRYDAEKNAVIISLEKDEQSALSPQKCTT